MGSTREDDGVEGSRKDDNSSLGLGPIASLFSVGIPEERAPPRMG